MSSIITWMDFLNKKHSLSNHDAIVTSLKRIYSQYLSKYFTDKYLDMHFYNDIKLNILEIEELETCGKKNEIISMKIVFLTNRLLRIVKELDLLADSCYNNTKTREKELTKRSYK